MPEDVANIGYDDIDFASAAVVPMASIRQPSESIGRRAIDLLLGAIDGGRPTEQVTFQPELIVRHFTRPR